MNNLKNLLKKIPIFLSAIIVLSLLNSCGGISEIWDPADARKVDPNVNKRVKKNLEEGRGLSIEKMIDGKKDGGGTTYQFASSNPMWRASLEILDFLPLSTVDYSGGMIVSDWYTGDSSNEAIKISIRFLSNEIRSDSLKIVVHKKKCSQNQTCKTQLLNNSKISQELRVTILKKAAQLEKEKKKK